MERDLGMMLMDVLNDMGAGPRVVDVTDDEWRKAAAAVAEAALKNAEDEWQKVIVAEELVVEAAVALVGEDIDAKRYWRLRDSLRAAVEALQKERE